MFELHFWNFLKRKILPKSLLSRFFLIIIVPTLIGQFFALRLFYERHWNDVLYRTSALIITEIEYLIQDKEILNKYHNQEQTYLNLSYIFLKNKKISLVSLQESQELEIFKKSLNRIIKFKNNVFIDENGKIIVLIEINDDLLKIKLPSKILINPTTYIFTLWVMFLTILLLSVSLVFSRNQIKSILELTNVAKKYGRGEKIDGYKPSGAKEIRQAGLAFIKMKDRIERQSARRTKMLAMISHDLKTPLTRMKLQVELMEDSEEKEELSHDIETMKYMISSYLDFARGEGGEGFVKIELNNWIEEYVNSFWKNPIIKVRLNKENLYVQIKPYAFSRALDNIISNAIKYSTKIEISVYSEAEDAFIVIEDNGKGIPDSEINLVFKPFYRIDKSRALSDNSGVGLGLAITKEIIISHYGSINLERSKLLNGLLVKIKIPCIDEAK